MTKTLGKALCMDNHYESIDVISFLRFSSTSVRSILKNSASLKRKFYEKNFNTKFIYLLLNPMISNLSKSVQDSMIK
ncbi:hypothetical protein DERP_003962 [Dermatophagoides pteronyssinus]|uniref:Uncharacterized protein n=1 Tax=Dermatophagoides pteronyssinus TaxID=6956 RepID=A0ABQ8J7T6_DERPT|nr:hypothetical protein DERP_003962 [Dermatophagoides pteronyssinus]